MEEDGVEWGWYDEASGVFVSFPWLPGCVNSQGTDRAIIDA